MLEWSGFKRNSIAEKERAIEALRYIGTTQFCFYYERLAFDEKGIPRKHKGGGWIKEEVTAVDTLFTVKEIRDDNKKIQYYEILPSPIFLDQCEGYFMLIPYNWREEVQKALGNKRVSSYTFRFLLFLRYKFEIKRRARHQLEISLFWQEIARAINMPESVYKGQKERALKILDETYATAKALGYLTDYNRKQDIDTLFLREEKYYNPEKFLEIDKDVKPVPIASEQARIIFSLFYEEKRKIDPLHKIPIGDPKNIHLRAIDQLLKDRSTDDVQKVIKWGMNKPFWCSRLTTPSKLRDCFSEVFSEMVLSLQSKPKEAKENNKEFAKKLLSSLKSKIPHRLKVELYNSYVEILLDGSPSATVISYEEKGFKDQLENALRKHGLDIKLL